MKRRRPEDEPDFAMSPPDDAAGVDTGFTRARRAPRRSGGSSGGWVPWLLLVMAAVAAGLANFWWIEPLRVELRQNQEFLAEANTNVSTLQAQVEALKANETDLAASRDALAQTVEQREQDLAAVQKAQEELAQKLQSEVDHGNVLIHQSEGELVVDLIDQVLFDSGEAALNTGGRQVLRNVGETLRAIPDKVIEVRGHTDAQPVLPPLTRKYATNWELSTQRATNVVRFLMEDVGVPGPRLVAAGYAQYHPIAENKSLEGRRRNRRIEVVLLPAHVKEAKQP